MCACACVRMCVGVRVRVCVCAWAKGRERAREDIIKEIPGGIIHKKDPYFPHREKKESLELFNVNKSWYSLRQSRDCSSEYYPSHLITSFVGRFLVLSAPRAWIWIWVKVLRYEPQLFYSEVFKQYAWVSTGRICYHGWSIPGSIPATVNILLMTTWHLFGVSEDRKMK